MEVDGAAVADPGHPRDPADAAAAAGRRRLPGRPRDRVGRPSRSSSASSPSQLVQKAFASGLFIFADADLKFDQPQAEVVFDRDKLRSQGVDLSQAGRDLSTLLGGDYVNRFSIQGRSYKVIPQVERAERLTPDQLDADLHHRRRTTSSCRCRRSRPCRTTAEPRELKKFQQLNAVRIQGVIPPPVPLDQALSVPRERGAGDPAAGLHDRLRGRVAPAAHRGQQVPRRRSCCRRS